MSTLIPRIDSPAKKLNNPIPGWLASTQRKWVGWGLIAIVIAYVGILIVSPLAALALGAFEQGPGAILEAFQQSFVLTSFWNTLWISLVVWFLGQFSWVW